MRILLAVLTSVLFFTACEFNQDPLTGAPGNVQENRAPDTNKPVPEKPIAKEGMHIDVPNKINGRVGSTIEFKIEGRVMVEGVEYVLNVDNLHDFPGATYDSSTGDFKWTPEKSFMAGEPIMEAYLRLTMATIPSDKFPVVSVERKDVTFVIVNAYTQPIIESITAESNYAAGTSYLLDILVEDQDAFTSENVKVVAADCGTYSRRSVNYLTYVDKVEKTKVANKYIVKMRLQLSSEDIPTGSYCVAYQAVSKHGVASTKMDKAFGIIGKPKETRTSIDSYIELKAGENLQRVFSVYDPSGNGTVSVTRVEGMSNLPGSTLECATSTQFKSQADCLLNLATAVDTPAKDFRVSVVTRSDVKGIAYPATNSHTFRIVVKAAQ